MMGSELKYIYVIILSAWFLLVHSCFAAPDSKSSFVSDYIAAYQDGQYTRALELTDKMSASGQQDAFVMIYRGACLAMLERYEDAVEAFEMGAVNLNGKLSDRTCLYLRALSQFHMQAYVSAQESMDELALRFPKSRLAEQAQRLALKIEKRLARGITMENLNWYLNKGLDKYNSERPYLVIEYLEEYLLLAKRSDFQEAYVNQRVNTLLGGSYLETSRFDIAIEYLERVTPGYEEYRADVLHAIALKGAGKSEEAIRMLRDVAARTKDTGVKERALRYIADWEQQL